MLTITIPGDEFWDDEVEMFRYTDDIVLEFEHSLVSLSKWEAKYHKLFLSSEKQTEDEMIGYIEAMLVTPGATREDLNLLTAEHVEQISQYVNDPMTGTTISNLPNQRSRSSERISNELIYFWMNEYKIDKACETWHLNRLFTLIKVHYAKTQKPQKINRQKHIQSMAELNAQRKAQMGTKG